MSSDSPNTDGFQASNLSVALTVKDMDKSLTWYRDVVGCAVEQSYEREGKVVAAAMRAGDTRFMINQDDGAKGWDRIKGQGFALQFTTSQRIDDIANGIKVRGGTLEMEPADMSWGARIFTLTDLDGYKLVISSPRGSV